jgi:UDP-glucose 4-epimerase
VRFGNVYGPRQIPLGENQLFARAIRHCLYGDDFKIYGDGNQTRDYVYVEDVVNAMVAAATAREINRLVINVGSGEETSVRELAKYVLETTNSSAEVIYNPRTDPGVSRMCADLTLAREQLGYRPRVSLEEGVRLTLEKDARFQNEATQPARYLR